MSQIAAIGYGGMVPMSGVVVKVHGTQAPPRPTPRLVVAPEPADVVGLTAGEALARWDERQIEEIRRQIAAGTYLTDEKVAVAVDRLYEALQDAAAVAGNTSP